MSKPCVVQAECYDYLFEAAVRMNAMGLDYRRPPPPTFADANGNGQAAAEAGAEAGRATKKLKSRHGRWDCRLPAASKGTRRVVRGCWVCCGLSVGCAAQEC